MRKLKNIFEEYLTRIGRLEPVKLGKADLVTVTATDNETFEQVLAHNSKTNGRIALAIVMSLLALVLIVMITMLRRIVQAQWIGYSVAGLPLLLLASFRLLYRLWVDKSVIDMSLGVVRNLPPQEAAKFINEVYWNAIHPLSKRKTLK